MVRVCVVFSAEVGYGKIAELSELDSMFALPVAWMSLCVLHSLGVQNDKKYKSWLSLVGKKGLIRTSSCLVNKQLRYKKVI